MNSFHQMKGDILKEISSGVDWSPKGSIDRPVRETVDFINSLDDYVTLSSCSGRISCYRDIKTKGVEWIIVKHRTVSVNEVSRAVDAVTTQVHQMDGKGDTQNSLISLKCEPFILHVLCRDVSSATKLYQAAMSSGYRESGIGIGARKTIVAIRTTALSLEMPIAIGSNVLLSEEGIRIVVEECNQRLLSNFSKIQKFLTSLKTLYSWPSCCSHIQPIVPQNTLFNRHSHSSTLLPTPLNDSAGNGSKSCDILTLGGIGMVTDGKSYGRQVKPFICAASLTEGLEVHPNVINPEIEGVVHAAMLTHRIRLAKDGTATNIDIVIISGGRKSPTFPLPSIYSVLQYKEGKLQPIEFSQTGTDLPSERWGHTLTIFDSRRLVMCGGRDSNRVHSDAYFLEISAVGNDQVFNECSSLIFQWTKIPDSILGGGSPSVFFHAACSLGDSAVLIHGGLNQSNLLNGNHSSPCCTGGKVLTIQSFLGVDDVGTESRNISSEDAVLSTAQVISRLCWSNVEFKNYNDTNRFGHTLTYIGSKTVVAVGGTSFSTDVLCNDINQESEKQTLEIWDVCMSGHMSDPPAAHVSVRNIPISYSDVLGNTDRKCSTWALQVACGGSRCHHQTVFDKSTGQLVVVGGGVECMALFGAMYCDTVVIRIGTSSYIGTTPGTVNSRKNKLQSTAKSTGATSKRRSIDSDTRVSADESHVALLVPKPRVRTVKVYLESNKWLDKTYRISALEHDNESVDKSAVTCTDLSLNDTDGVSVRHGSQNMESFTQCCDEMMAVPVTVDFYNMFNSKKTKDEFSCDKNIFKKLYSCLVAPLPPPARSVKKTNVKDEPQSLEPTKSPVSSVDVSSFTAESSLSDCTTISLHFVHQICRKSKTQIVSGHSRARDYLKSLVPIVGVAMHTDTSGESQLSSLLIQDIPKKFEMVGDVLMIPEDCMLRSEWEHACPMDEIWRQLLDSFNQSTAFTNRKQLTRIARKARIDKGPKRESHVRFLYIDPGFRCRLAKASESNIDALNWVEVVENRICFGFDITKVMFCSGNVTERMRMASWKNPLNPTLETIVDLYCGIGYYTVPFLVHAGVATVHACEWNPNSVTALKCNLRKANVSTYESIDEEIVSVYESQPSDTKSKLIVKPKCIVHLGDNNIAARCRGPLAHIADRVCLGLLPSSVAGWPLAVNVLKRSGGVLHVHENVHENILEEWVHQTCRDFEAHFLKYDESVEAIDEVKGESGTMKVECLHLERVKSFAPRVFHVVADLLCTRNTNIGT